MFIFIGFATGILYVLGTPPYYMLDEPNHYFRAYQVSCGTIIPERIGDKTGGPIPRSMSTSVYVFRFGIQQYKDGGISPDLIRGSLSLPLNEADTGFVAFSNTAIYSPIPYIPQAIGIGIGRTLDLSPLVLLYLGRLANLAFALLALALAMQILPVVRWAMFLILLSPTAMFQIASASADVMLFALSFLFIALVLKEAFGTRRTETVQRKTLVWLVVLSAGIALCKSAYVFLPVLILLIPASRVQGKWRLALLSGGMVVLQVAVAGLWATAVKDVYTPFINPDVDPAASLQWIAANPAAFLGVALQNVFANGWFYLQGLVGLQWNQQAVLMPESFSAAYIAVILITTLLSGDPYIEIGVRKRGVLLFFTILSFGFLLLTVYLSWMAPGSLMLEGVQGRYFIPVLLPAFLLLYTKRFSVRAVENSLAIILPLFTFVSLIYALVLFHRLF